MTKNWELFWDTV